MFEARESLKLLVRRIFQKADLDIGRGAYQLQLTHTLNHFGIDRVLDVGANIGQFATLLRAAGFSGHIVSVEPLDHAFQVLSRRARRDSAWQTVQAALGAAPGTGQIHVSANSYSSSILEVSDAHLDADPTSGTVGTQPVDVRTVADLVTELGVNPKRTMLKIDTQGYEGAVLDGCGEDLGHFAAIQLELSTVELYEGQDLLGAMLSRLLSAGYEPWTLNRGISDRSNGRLLQCDVLFLRSDAILQRHP